MLWMVIWCLQVERVEGEGYYGGVRLLMATCKVFHAYCSDHGIPLHDRNFTLSYDTNVPRQVSGAEAINLLVVFLNWRLLACQRSSLRD